MPDVETSPPPRHEDTAFERSDVNWKGVLLTGAGVFAVLWIATGVLFFVFTGLKAYRASVSPPPLPYEAHGDVQPPEPRLQRSPREDFKQYTERLNWEQQHYRWLDKQHGVVSIPIEQAIETLAKRGIPAATGAPNPTNTPPAEGTRETGFSGKVEPEPR